MFSHQFVRFLLVGTLTAATDFVTYRGLVWAELFSINAAKATGFILGTLFAYFANHYWTFGEHAHGHRRWVRFVALYGAGMFINVHVNATVLSFLGMTPLSVSIAFVVATGLSACMNFLGMKFFVFAPPRRAD